MPAKPKLFSRPQQMPLNSRRGAPRSDLVGASDVAVGDRLPGDLADVHPMLKPSTIVSTASPPLRLRPTGVPTIDTVRA